MKLLVYCSHPAQFLFYKNIINGLEEKGHQIKLLIKSKDVLEDLLVKEGFKYENILSEGRKSSKLGILIGLLKRLIRINRIIRRFRPDIMLGTDASIAQLSWLYKKPSLITLEDDISVIRYLAKLTYPFASYIITPKVCDVGRWESKQIGYDGYMKLAYLHPSHFKLPSVSSELNEPFALIRLSKLDAHHDDGIGGISVDFLRKIIEIVKDKMMVYITSEKSLSNDLEKYKLQIETDKIHYYLKHANLLISDSQSMSVEAAMLGTPSIRISDFYGRISVLNELEEKYGLTFGFLPSDKTSILSKINELLALENISQIFHERTKKMLDDKIDVTRFMVWFIENYPESASIIKENPEYQYRFK